MLFCWGLVHASHANLTTLQFTKGSHCTMFAGDYAHRVFELYLSKGQEFSIEPLLDDSLNEVQYAISAEQFFDAFYKIGRVIVKNPKGQEIYADGDYAETYKAETTGKYTVRILPPKNYDGYAKIEFCVG